MALDIQNNFAWGTVLTAPSPASSGTTIFLTAGHGARFPAAPFNLVVCPTGTRPLASNSEIVRVTDISVDTLTITRAQESSSARTIVAGDQIFQAITKKTFTDITDQALTSTSTPTFASVRTGNNLAGSLTDFTTTVISVAATYATSQNPTAVNGELFFLPTSPMASEASAGIFIQYWGGSAIGSTGTGYGLQGASYFQGETPSTLASIVGVSAISGAIKRGATATGTLTNAYGVSVLMFNSGGGTITNAYGVSVTSSVVNVATSSITNNYGVFVGYTGVNTGATVVNDYGLYIRDRQGTTLNYAIYTETGLVRFGGVVLGPAGAVGAPTYSFSGAATTGLYYNSGISASIAGTERLNINASGLTLTVDGNAYLSVAGTTYFKPASGNTNQTLQIQPLGSATLANIKLFGQASTSVGTRGEFEQSGADTTIRNQHLGAGVNGNIIFQFDGATALQLTTTLAGFGGITSSFPALKRSATILQVRLADDSDFTFIQGKHRTHANLTSGLVAATVNALVNSSIVFYDAAGTAITIYGTS